VPAALAKARRPGVDIQAAYAAARKHCDDCPMDRMRRQAKIKEKLTNVITQ
jgi:hypothetical protein